MSDIEAEIRNGLAIVRLTDAPTFAAARSMLAPMASNAPLSNAGMKLALNALAEGGVERQQAGIGAAIARVMDSDDYREGSRAFLEKRAPRFIRR